MKLLLTHGDESNRRIKEGLSSHGIDVVIPETTGRAYTLDERIEADVGLVYPSRLAEGGVVDALCDIDWVVGASGILTTRNKARTLALLEETGLHVPETHYLSSPVSGEEARAAFEDVGPPAVVKPNSASSGRGAVLVHDPDSVTGVADLFGVVHESSLVEDRSFLVQEYIKEARDFRVMVIGGDYVGAVERRATGWKKNVHAGAEASGLRPPEEVVACAEKAARALGVEFCGVDVLSGDTTVVNEVNARPTVDDVEKYEDRFYARLARVIKEVGG